MLPAVSPVAGGVTVIITCDWLMQIERKVSHSGDLSIEEMVEKLKKVMKPKSSLSYTWLWVGVTQEKQYFRSTVYYVNKL